MNNRLCLILISVACWGLTFSPHSMSESTSLLKQTGFRQFSTEQGLSQNTINSFYQDNNGFMWIATEAGLNRLDGAQIEYFTGPDAILTGNSISNVKEDSAGTLWVATFDHLYRIDKPRQYVESFPLPELPTKRAQGNFVIDILEDTPETYWIVSRDAILKLQPDSKDIKLSSSMQALWDDGAQIDSALNSKEFLWLATSKGLYRFDKNNASISKHLLSPEFDNDLITAIVLLDENNLLATTRHGAILTKVVAGENFKPHTITTVDIASAVKLDDVVFMAGKDRLYLYQVKTQNLSHVFSLSEILPRYSAYRIRKLFIDQRQKLWIGTESQGAFLWDPNSLKFKTISSITNNPNLKLSHNTVWGFVEDNLGDFWIATENGLNHLKIEQAQIESYLTSDLPALNDDTARLLYVVNDGDILWLATGDGLIKYNTQTGDFKIFKPERIQAHQAFFIFSLTRTPEGIIWLATDLGPVSFNPATEEFHFNNTLQPHGDPEEATFIRYYQDKIWIGYANRLDTYDYKRKQKNTVFKFDHLKKSYDLSLTDFYLDDSKLWVSFSAAGIYILDLNRNNDPVIKHLDQKHGFVDNIIHSLSPTNEYIWASSHSGLIKINKKDFSYHVFDFYNGLPTNEFNEGAAMQTNAGNLLFGGANGILMISPESLQTELERTKPTVTSISLHDRKLISSGIDWSKRDIQINEDNSFITFNLSVLDYLSPHKWHYEYWLSGDKDTSSITTSDKQITFTNLASGKYQLNVRAVLPNSLMVNTITTLPFQVSKPRGPFFEIKIAAVSLLLLFVGWYWYRQNRFSQQLSLTNSQLKQKKQSLELALLDKHQGVWDWKNLSGKLVDSTITMFMHESENIIVSLKQYRSYIHPEDVSKNRREWLNFLHGKSDEIHLTYRVYMFEKWIWCRVQGKISQRFDNGKPARATGTWLDITKEHKASEKLKLFEKAIQSTRDIIFILDNQLNIISVNNAYQNFTGFSRKSLLGKNVVRIAQKRFDYETAEAFEKHLREKKTWQGEATMPTKDSPSFPIDVRIDAFAPDKDDTNFIMVMTDISSLSDRMESQINSSYFDAITGLPNRVLAHDRLSHAIAHARLHKTNVVLIYMDLDKFDFYQETLGKSNSREIVVNVSKQISKVLNKDDTFARVERDKFFVILENEDKLENISFKIEEVMTQLSKPQLINQSNIQVTACVGIACFPHDANSTNKLMECSKQALKQAKSSGVNKISYYHRDMNKKASDRLAMKTSLHHAIKNNQFFLVYQPKFDLDNQQINGFEVFVRWRTADGNIIYPSQFIKIAEETGLIESLTEWLINQAFRTLRQWKQDGISTVFSINLFPKYCHNIGSPEYIVKKLNEYDLSPVNIQIEINEKHFTEDISTNLSFLTALSHKGFNITLDDFGSGNTPLNYLKNLPIDAVKLERNFIRNIGKDKTNDSLLNSIIQMANGLGFIPSAKSIEYQEQVEFLLEAGCKVGQGYLFSDPLTESSARQFMLKSEEKV